MVGATSGSVTIPRRRVDADSSVLPDVAPTILDHQGVDRPPAMNGRPFYSIPAPDDPVQEAVDLDRESVFVDSMRGPLSAAFVVFQVIVFLLILGLLYSRERRGVAAGRVGLPLELAGLAVVAFPVTTYLAGVMHGHELGRVWFVALLIAIDAVLVALTRLLLRRSLDRLLALTAFTLLVVAADLVAGSRLQLNTVFGYSPIVAGRFTGAGNIVFAVLGVAAVMTGALVAHRWGGRTKVLIVVALVFAGAVIVDGAPQFGSDVGGVLALVPAFGLTWLLLAERRPSLKVIALAAVAALVVLGLFLVVDLSRPPESRTHLARLFEDARARGPGVVVDTIMRKAAANLRVFRTTVWTYFVPPAALVMAYLLYRPTGRWERLAQSYPKLRSGFIGGLVLAVLGFAVNDSGIVIPAVVLSFLVPMALLVHLAMEADTA
jgi:cbb3-type cytochrome oxidase subunit 3